MNSVGTAPARVTPTLQPEPPADYASRALALWPRIERQRLARVKHDPRRVAALISHRTRLSIAAILELLGAPPMEAGAPKRARDH
jgi:hypothetical protein